MSRREHYNLNTKYYGLPAPPKSTMPGSENNFPDFTDGDVLIIITSARRYKLHSSVLRRSSPTLVSLLDEAPAADLSRNAKKKGMTIRYRLHLDENEEPRIRGVCPPPPTHVLRRILIDENAAPISAYPDLLGDANENGRVVPQYVLAWEQVLGVFYNRHLDIGDKDSDSIGSVLEASGNALTVAEYLKNPAVVMRPIEANLLSFGQPLHRSISFNPAPWLDFSFRLRSKTLWREALIHGAGRFNTSDIQNAIRDNTMDSNAIAILTEKASRLKNLARITENTLLSYYPEGLQRTKTVGRADRDSIGRASYANDIMQWIGLTVWRHWLSQQLCNDMSHNATDMGFEFFSLIAKAGESYLDRNQLRQFHEYFPMSLKGESVVENRISELKQDGQGMVRKVLVNESQLDIDKNPANHMTCTWVGPDDYPWDRAAREFSIADRTLARSTVEPSDFGGDMDVDGMSVAE